MLFVAGSAIAQQESLESRVSKVERQVNDRSAGIALFLFGAFCALWAQNTGRSAWLWFFLGLLFSIFAVIVLLAKNSSDRKKLAPVSR
jgi:hypothetical protein